MIHSTEIFEYLHDLIPEKKYLIAYSGGLDSHVLLHLMAKITDDETKVRAAHIHHGLQKEADDWVIHCQNITTQLDIPLEIFHVNLQETKGKSLEEVARKERYKVLYTSLHKDEVLLTAHHQNDQAETLLLQLFRGAGVSGLAAMPKIRKIAFGSKSIQHARPLLDYSLQSLKDYALKYKLNYIEDPSNQDDVFDRNFLRNQIMPQLRERWSGVDKALSRSASIQAETKLILDELAEQELSSILSSKGNIVHIPTLSKLPEIKQKLVVRHWINKNGFLSPSDKKLDHIFHDVINAREDAQPLVEWSNVQLRRYQRKLYIMSPLVEHDNKVVIEWDVENDLEIPSLGINLQSKEVQHLIKETSKVSVRFRQGGESLFVPKKGFSVSLKNVLHEAGIPPWLRSRIPLIFIDDELKKVIGI
ncbi:MAG: tRNA lysidine(34) synthetase TilS [Cocleimonas sp.]